VLVAAFGFSTLGPLAHYASQAGMTALTFSTWRSVAATVMLAGLLALLVGTGRSPLTRWRDVPDIERIQLAAMGLFVTGTTTGLFLAFERMSIALALIIFYAYPSFVAVAATRINGEPLTPGRVLATTLALTGMTFLIVAPQLGGGALALDALGVGFALLAAASQGGYALTAARGFRSVPSFQAATLIRAASLVLSLILVVPLLFLVGEGADLWEKVATPDAWILILLAASVGAALPAVALVIGYRRVGSFRGAILMIVEPVVGVALAALLLGERPSSLQLLGGLLVLAAAVLAAVTPRGRARVPVPDSAPAE
jgi:drug/metabolite transporter (DMT)-like permease